MASEATKIPFIEAAAPSTPAASRVVIYAKSDGLMYSKDDAGAETLMSGGAGGGSVATDAIWDAAGDLVQGTGANTGARLALGAAGTVVRSTGATNAYAFPPGHEFDYAAFTSPVSVTATAEGSADTVIAGASVAYDGSTIVLVEFYSPQVSPQLTDGDTCTLLLFEDSTNLGQIGKARSLNGATTQRVTVYAAVRRTPSNASHTYTVKAITTSGTSTVGAGAGGSGNLVAGFLRVTKV